MKTRYLLTLIMLFTSVALAAPTVDQVSIKDVVNRKFNRYLKSINSYKSTFPKTYDEESTDISPITPLKT